jgi:hypothetical protein
MHRNTCFVPEHFEAQVRQSAKPAEAMSMPSFEDLARLISSATVLTGNRRRYHENGGCLRNQKDRHEVPTIIEGQFVIE